MSRLVALLVAVMVFVLPLGLVFGHSDELHVGVKEVKVTNDSVNIKKYDDEDNDEEKYERKKKELKKHREHSRIVSRKINFTDDLLEKKILIKKKLKKLSPEERKALVMLTKEELEDVLEEEDVEEIKEKIREKIKKRAKYEKLGWKLREVDEEEREEVIKELREKMKEVREKLREHKEMEEELRELKAELKECEAEGVDCSALREEFINKSKEYLINAIDTAIDHLVAVKDKLSVSEYLNESEVNEAISNIEDLIARLNAVKENVSACETLACLRENARMLGKEIKKVKLKVKEKVYEEENYRKGLIIERGKAILARLEFMIEYAKKNNISLEEYYDDIEEIKELVYAAEEYKRQADEYMESAKRKIDAGDIEGAQKDLELAKEALEEARDYLKDANEELQDIWNEIKRDERLRFILVAKTEELESRVVEIEKEEEEGEIEIEIEYKRNESDNESNVVEVEIEGKMYYEDIEGGVWIVETDEGKYQILNFDVIETELDKNTTYYVEIEGIIEKDVVTTTMVGTPLKILEIRISASSEVEEE